MSQFGIFRISKDMSPESRRSSWPARIAAGFTAASIIGAIFSIGFACGKQDRPEVHIGFNAKTCVLDMGGAIVDSSASSLFTTWLANHRCT
ncbi:hypothetical protein [Burkholderia cepacia]|uniref:hypothetical protein n=1 Tax=Burkholderia cepacia TaxID=292 RepID=UPI00299043DF|nr:hypothetical protein [Burkholderia cepacia]